MSGKEVQFFLFNGIKLVKMHSAYIFGYQYILITKPSASFENSTSAHGGFRENLRIKHRSS